MFTCLYKIDLLDCDTETAKLFDRQQNIHKTKDAGSI